MNKSKISFQITGTPLIKFQKAKRIEQLQKGKIYANTLGYYRKLEETTGDKTVGDKFEAMVHINEAIITIPEKGEEIVVNDELIRTAHSDDYIYCMFAIDPEQDSFVFTEEQKDKLLSFGDTALVILDSKAFIDRVISAAEKAGYVAYFNGVKYYNETIDNGNLIIDLLKGMHNVAFWKRDCYAYQQEARFVFVSDKNHDDHIELDIGDISDISLVFPTKQVLTGVSTKMNSE